MLIFKEKVLVTIEDAEGAIKKLIEGLDSALYKLKHAKELTEEIRTEPTRFGVPKGKTTLDDIEHIHNKLIDATKKCGDALGLYGEVWKKVDRLSEVSGNEQGRVCFEAEVKAGRAGYGEYKAKSEDGSTIIEVDKVKLVVDALKALSKTGE